MPDSRVKSSMAHIRRKVGIAVLQYRLHPVAVFYPCRWCLVLAHDLAELCQCEAVKRCILFRLFPAGFRSVDLPEINAGTLSTASFLQRGTWRKDLSANSALPRLVNAFATSGSPLEPCSLIAFMRTILVR